MTWDLRNFLVVFSILQSSAEYSRVGGRGAHYHDLNWYWYRDKMVMVLIKLSSQCKHNNNNNNNVHSQNNVETSFWWIKSRNVVRILSNTIKYHLTEQGVWWSDDWILFSVQIHSHFSDVGGGVTCSSD